MDFPLPIRSFTSTMDYTTPLCVDTNIVYQIDETKFIGLQESSHATEPALMIDCNTKWNSNHTCDEMTDQSITDELITDELITDEEETQELYNLIESLDVEDTVLFPIDASVNILDLSEMQLQTSAVEVSVPKIDPIVYTSVLDVHSENIYNNRVDYESLNCLTSNIDYSLNIYESQSSGCEEHHQMPSCRFTNRTKFAKRKRHLSSANQEDLMNSIETEVWMSSKRKKLDPQESCLPTYSDGCYLDSFMDDNISPLSFYHEAQNTSMFNFCENYYKRFV